MSFSVAVIKAAALFLYSGCRRIIKRGLRGIKKSVKKSGFFGRVVSQNG
jgi:hypothetical protein